MWSGMVEEQWDDTGPGPSPALHRVVFTPSGLHGEVDHGTTVLGAARRLGVDLDTVCGGRGICGRCQVMASVGRFPKWGITVDVDALGPPVAFEVDYRGARPLAAGFRLGCAASILGDVVVDVPAASQVHRQVVRKELGRVPTFPMTVDPSFTLHYVEVAPAALGDGVSAADTLAAAVAEQHGRAAPTLPFPVLASMQAALGRDRGAVTVALDESNRVVAVWPGFVDAAYGIALDIGSTTIAGHLCELTSGELLVSVGRMNPQIRYGEDLMSRVSYVMMNPGGERELTAAVRSEVDDLIGELVDEIASSRDRVLEVVAVGNPIMHHVFLGIDPTPLGQAPFTLATDRAVMTGAADVGLTLPNARCYVGPCIAGHVGADTAAAMLAERPHASERTQLLVDIGTNAEIVLGDAERQFAASSPTGPAFEGAQISCGQRATTGAIEAVRIDPASLEPRVKVIGVDSWSDHADFAAAIRRTGVTGICGSGVIDAVAEMFLAGVIDANGAIRGELASQSERIVPDGRTFQYVLWSDGSSQVTVTQNDVRAIQLAKAALRAGIELLLDRAGRPELTDVRLAGGFGAHIDPIRAMVLGLVPDCAPESVQSVGNAAGAGAVQALLSRAARADMESAVRHVVKVETATEPRFQELFVAAMAIPHATAPSPHLATVVALPATRTRDQAARRHRGARP